jgi:predicted transposase YdaD
MYDAREKAIRDRKWQLNAARQEGEDKGRVEGKLEGKLEGERDGLLKGEIKLVRMLQGLLYMPLADEQELAAMSLQQLEALTSDLQEKLRSRTPA